MARSRNVNNAPFHSFNISSVSPFVSVLLSPKQYNKLCMPSNLTLFLISLCFSLAFLGISALSFMHGFQDSVPCALSSHATSFPVHLSSSTSSASLINIASLAAIVSNDEPEGSLSRSAMMPLPVHGVSGNVSKEEREFWQQPDGEGYRPCLDFSIEYRRASAAISKEKRRFLMVVVSGGLNQQRNQIVDTVVMARILEAALVVPVLRPNLVWEDESEFSDIFDIEHFKKTLQPDVRVVSSLPSSHLMSQQSIETRIPQGVSPLWIRTRFFRQLNEEGVLILKGLDSKLSKNLPPDLQKLRCKVAFHALRFASPLRELGNRLARRMWIEGPYIAVHLRLEKDVWIRSGCLTGLGPKYDRIINNARKSQPEFLTGKLNMSYKHRRLAGLCPLNALEVSRFLKALGAKNTSRVFRAGGEPFGGTIALQPLASEFPILVSKEMLAQDGELKPYYNRSSALAAIDYIVSLSSDVFVPSHGGNMGRALQGHRAYVGHRKYVMPNKRVMLPIFEDKSISDAEFSTAVRKIHKRSRGQPEARTSKRNRDVLAYPVPECMCKHRTSIF